MELSREQDRAIKSVQDWYRDPSSKQVFRLFGYAGTGKTTLAKHFADSLGIEAVYGAFTGKAAHVLYQKGCYNATTLHKLIYTPQDKAKSHLHKLEDQLQQLIVELSNAGVEQKYIDEHKEVIKLRREIAEENDNLSRPNFTLNHDSPVKHASLLIVDEVSMVDEYLGKDLESFGTKILVLGDPAQLPPVMGGGYFTEQEPDVMLTEIHRQARDNPIIDLATRVRKGDELLLGRYGESRVLTRNEISPEYAMKADQILVGRNKTRNATNRRVRSLLGLNPEHPVESDRLVCLKNDHEVGLLNGGLWNVDQVNAVNNDYINFDIRSIDGDVRIGDISAHMHHFKNTNEKLAWWARNSAQEFDYGYVLTVHKSQGSQWDNVLLFDESRAFRENARRWLYTGITRAAEKITIVTD